MQLSSKDTILADPEIENMAALYRQHAPVILSYLSRHLSSAEDAEDMLVEVFLAALENPHFIALPEKARLAWLWRVTHNKLVDTYRRAVRRRGVTLESVAEHMADDEIDPEQFILQQEEYHHLQEHIKRLSPQQQEVLRLRFSQGMRCSEIAAQMGKREGAVKVMLSRTLNLLKSIYKGYANEK